MIVQTYDKWEKNPVILTFDEKHPADIKNIAIPFDEIFSSCVYHSITLHCNKVFFEVRTDEEICYSFNMLNHKDILNDIIDDSLKYPKHDKHAVNWTLQDGYIDISSTVYPERKCWLIYYQMELKRSTKMKEMKESLKETQKRLKWMICIELKLIH